MAKDNMTVRVVEETLVDKAIKKLFGEELPAIGIATDRNIYRSAWEVAWPLPPHPSKEGKYIRWRDYVSSVRWDSRLLDLLAEVGGERRIREAVLSCRIQDQVERLYCDLKDATAPDEESEA